MQQQCAIKRTKTPVLEKAKGSRAKLTVDLKKLGFTIRDSQGNFVLATPAISQAEYLYIALKECDSVRYFSQPGLHDKPGSQLAMISRIKMLIAALASLIK
ncbi:MAG: hypothetical protein WKF84_06290 [Pyrinomonadaceae bacterium]